MKKFKWIFLIFIVVFVMMSLTSCKAKKIREECYNEFIEQNNGLDLQEANGKLTSCVSDDSSDGDWHLFNVKYIPENDKYIKITDTDAYDSKYSYQLTPTLDVDIEIPMKIVFTPFETNNQKQFEMNVTFLMHAKSYYYDYYFQKYEVCGKDSVWHSRTYMGEKEWYYSAKDSNTISNTSKFTSNTSVTLNLQTMDFDYWYKYTSAVGWNYEVNSSGFHYYIKEKYLESDNIKLYLDRKNANIDEDDKKSFAWKLEYVKKLDLAFNDMGLEEYISPLFEKNDYSVDSLF